MNSTTSVLAGAGDEAVVLAEVAWVLIVGASLVFVVTMGLLALGLRRHKRAIPTGWWVIGAGFAFPLVVLSALLVYATLRTAALDRAPRQPLVIGITAHLWWWEIRYQDPATGQDVRLANQLHLPAGRAVQLGLLSADAIHSVWVPALGGKMDTVPGRVNKLVVTAREPGVYRGACAEFCGEQHARMALHVVVQTGDEFDRWLAQQALPARAIGSAGTASASAVAASAVHTADDARLQRGRQAFLDHGCATCHTVRGVVQGAGLGPDLTHVGSRLHLGAGVLRNQPGAMALWLTGIQQLKPGARMPSFQHLDATTLDALAAYLERLQ